MKLRHTLSVPVFYLVSGLLVFFCFVMIVYTYLVRLKVETAVVSSVIETMVSPMNGYIAHVFVAMGDEVKQGEPLLKIENMELERALQLACVQVEEDKASVDYYKKLIMSERQRLKLYHAVGHHRVVSAQTWVNRSIQDVLIAEHNLARFKALYKKKYVSQAELESKALAYQHAQEKLIHAKSQHHLENHSLHAVNQGMYFTGTKTEGVGRDLNAECAMAKKRVTLSLHRVAIYEKLIAKLTLIAPFDGKVNQVLLSAGNTTNTIKPLLLIEKSKNNKQIMAYLTQDEIIHIGSSRHVKLYIPSLGQTYRGSIIEINRTDGFIDTVKAQYRWRDIQQDRSAMVKIGIDAVDQNRFDQDAFSGMPVVVYFTKKSWLW